MVLVIDASNIRTGGGIAHLKGILKYYVNDFGFSKIIIYSSQVTLDLLPDKPWLIKKTHKFLNRSFLSSFYFQVFILSKLVRVDDMGSIVFAPGGTFLGNFRPFVTMSRNMLPFERKEAFRYKSWRKRLRFLVLFLTQSLSYKRAGGVIFLTEYARDVVSKYIANLTSKSTLIPHGIDPLFCFEPREQRNIGDYSDANPYKFLYVSVVTAYKHQWNVAKAILKLKEDGHPVSLDLIGPYSSESIKKLDKVISDERNENKVIRYLGTIQNTMLPHHYRNADSFVFASSCENLPNILIEAMASGLPIASSDMGPMREVLGDAGLFFNPLDVDSIYNCLKRVIQDPNMRSNIADIAFSKANRFTWRECSKRTFQYIKEINDKYIENGNQE